MTLLLVAASAAAAYSDSFSVLDARRFGGVSIDVANDVSVSIGGGRTYLTGSFRRSVSFGGDTFTSVFPGWEDVFAAMYAADGTHLWSQQLGGETDDSGTVIRPGLGGDRIIGATVDKNGPEGVACLFVNQYPMWKDDDVGTSYLLDLTVDPGGDIVVVGWFDGQLQWGAQLLTATARDAFVGKIDADGTLSWIWHDGGADIAVANSIAGDNLRGYVVVGDRRSNSNGPTTGWLKHLSADGTVTWSHQVVDASFRAVDMDASGGTVVTGGAACAPCQDVWSIKYDRDGSAVWSRRSPGLFATGRAVGIDAAGNAVIAGSYRSSIDLGGGPLTHDTSDDIFVVEYDSLGVYQRNRGFGGPGSDIATSLAVVSDGTIMLAGSFESTMKLDGITLTSAGYADALLMRLTRSAGPALGAPTIGEIVDVPNDQGGHVLIHFDASSFDTPGSTKPISRYVVYRHDPSLVAVRTLFAHGRSEYSVVAPTLADRTLNDPTQTTTFTVRAVGVDSLLTIDSTPASGYSVDNLVPTAPTGFAYDDGVLSWSSPADPDVADYAVYGSARDVFDATARLIAVTTAPPYDVSGSSFAFYYVVARDRGGNASDAAMVAGEPNTLVIHPALQLSVYPNPFNPTTTIRFELPSRGRATIRIYDSRGALVTTLVNEVADAGPHEVVWEGRDAHNIAVGSGIYFVSIEFAGRKETLKAVLIK